MVDGTQGKKSQEVVDQICKSAQDNVGMDAKQIDKFQSRIFVLSKSEIEAYLIKPSAISRVFEIPEGEVQAWFRDNDKKKNKFYVLDRLLRKHGKGRYDKKADGARIAKALTQLEIDQELVEVIEQIVQLSRKAKT